jgi:hemerythrin-like domain-containing protein
VNAVAATRIDARAGGLRALLLSDHNDRLELMLDEVILHWEDTGGAGPYPVWRRFTQELSRHLEIEEKLLLPEFGRAHPAEAKICATFHAQLRDLVARADSELELHARQIPSVLALQRAVRTHARQADGLLYPWAVSTLESNAWKEVRAQMRKLLFDAPPQRKEEEP